jgi:hypothetical protein
LLWLLGWLNNVPEQRQKQKNKMNFLIGGMPWIKVKFSQDTYLGISNKQMSIAKQMPLAYF